LFEDLSTRYEKWRTKTGVNKGAMEKVTRAPVLAACVLALGGIAYFLWKRRRRFGAKEAEKEQKEKLDKRLEAATTLHRALEQALASHGISRPPSLPPLRHAEELRTRQHPLADEVIALTNVYLEARFGGLALDDTRKKDFEKRVKEIRGFKPPPASAATP